MVHGRAIAHELLRRYKFNVLLDSGPPSGGAVSLGVQHCISDPFQDLLWLATAVRADDPEHSLHRLFARIAEANWTGSANDARQRMWGHVTMFRRDAAVGRTVRFSYSGFDSKPFDLDARDEGHALEWIALTGVRYSLPE